jgi:hypothetical protein
MRGKSIFEVNPSGSLERGRGGGGGGGIVITVGHDLMILKVEYDGGKKVLKKLCKISSVRVCNSLQLEVALDLAQTKKHFFARGMSFLPTKVL